MRVMILKTDERLGVKAGEIYSAQRYWFDPGEKVTLLEREPDGYNPGCNQYVHEVAFWMNDKVAWCRVEGSRYVEIPDAESIELMEGEND